MAKLKNIAADAYRALRETGPVDQDFVRNKILLAGAGIIQAHELGDHRATAVYQQLGKHAGRTIVANMPERKKALVRPKMLEPGSRPGEKSRPPRYSTAPSMISIHDWTPLVPKRQVDFIETQLPGEAGRTLTVVAWNGAIEDGLKPYSTISGLNPDSIHELWMDEYHTSVSSFFKRSMGRIRAQQ